METNFQSLFLTTFTAPEFKFLLRQELEAFFERKKNSDLQCQEEDQLLTIKEAADLLKYSVPSIYRLISAKQIPNLKRGGKILFSKDELLAWAKEGRRKTVKEIEEDAERYLGAQGDKKRAINLKPNRNEK